MAYSHPSLPGRARFGALWWNVVGLLDRLGGILCGEGGTHHVADFGILRLEDIS